MFPGARPFCRLSGWPSVRMLILNSYSLWARILPFSEYHHLIMPKKFMDQNFNLGPGFWAMAKRAQNGLKLKNWTPPTFFELESSSLRIMLTYPRAKNQKSTVFWALGRSTIPENMKGLPKKLVVPILTNLDMQTLRQNGLAHEKK